jgi:hypothetical protein
MYNRGTIRRLFGGSPTVKFTALLRRRRCPARSQQRAALRAGPQSSPSGPGSTPETSQNRAFPVSGQCERRIILSVFQPTNGVRLCREIGVPRGLEPPPRASDRRRIMFARPRSRDLGPAVSGFDNMCVALVRLPETTESAERRFGATMQETSQTASVMQIHHYGHTTSHVMKGDGVGGQGRSRRGGVIDTVPQGSD